ncbi:hypothetical protein [Streptomyces sp. NPDC001978]|uniref:hypothetical protein n=1 Tax=Streptomyces sp. NPDC001978 TaxID=3364627 RepID=UPI003686313B
MDAICDPLDSDRSDLDSYIGVVRAFNARWVLDIGCGAVCDTRFRSEVGSHAPDLQDPCSC